MPLTQNRCGKKGLPKYASFKIRPTNPIMAIRPRVTSNCRQTGRRTSKQSLLVNTLCSMMLYEGCACCGE